MAPPPKNRSSLNHKRCMDNICWCSPRELGPTCSRKGRGGLFNCKVEKRQGLCTAGVWNVKESVLVFSGAAVTVGGWGVRFHRDSEGGCAVWFCGWSGRRGRAHLKESAGRTGSAHARARRPVLSCEWQAGRGWDNVTVRKQVKGFFSRDT